MQIAQGVIPLQKPSRDEILNDFHPIGPQQLMKRQRWHLPCRQTQEAGLVRGNERRGLAPKPPMTGTSGTGKGKMSLGTRRASPARKGALEVACGSPPASAGDAQLRGFPFLSSSLGHVLHEPSEVLFDNRASFSTSCFTWSNKDGAIMSVPACLTEEPKVCCSSRESLPP